MQTKRPCTSYLVRGPLLHNIAILSLQYIILHDACSQGDEQLPKLVRYPHPPPATWAHAGTSVRYIILQRIARQVCDSPQKQAQTSFAILSLQASCDMKSIVVGPLRPQECPSAKLSLMPGVPELLIAFCSSQMRSFAETRKCAQKSANEGKRAQTRIRKRAQKSVST